MNLEKKLSTLLTEHNEVYLNISKQKTKYRILKALGSKLKTYYIVHPGHIISIATLLRSNPLNIDTGYITKYRRVREHSKLIVTDEAGLLDKIETKNDENEPYTFAKIVVVDEGLERNELGRLSYNLWNLSTKQKFRFVFFSSKFHDSHHKIYNMDHYPHTTNIIYLKHDLNKTNLIGEVSNKIIELYADLRSGCCVVVFIANVEQEIEIKEKLFQLKDHTVSTLTQKYQDIARVSHSDRPNIVFTNNSTDISALADVSIVIDLLLEEDFHKIRYISKHQADKRALRVTMENGSCYRMITKNSYQKLRKYHLSEIIKLDYLMLKLIKSGIDINRISDIIGVSKSAIEDRLHLYRQMTILDSKNKLTILGKINTKVNVSPRSFQFLNLWYKNKHKLFPAIVLTGLLEYGKTDYFEIPHTKNHLKIMKHIDEKHGYYIRQDDAQTFFTIYSELMEDFKGLPNLEKKDDILFVKKWTSARGLNYEHIREITFNINNLIDELSDQKYKITTGSFDVKNAMYLTRRYTTSTHITVYLKNGVYHDENENIYKFGQYHFHTLRQDLPNTMIVLEYLKSNSQRSVRYIQLAINNNEVNELKPEKVPMFSFREISDNVNVGLDIFSKINLYSYIMDDNQIQINNTKLMEPKYKEWFSDKRPVLSWVLLDDDVYSQEEYAQINTNVEFSSTLTKKTLLSRDIGSIFNITISWFERGRHLVEKEFLTKVLKLSDKVIYTGKITPSFSILVQLFPKLKFTVFSESNNVPEADNVINKIDIENIDEKDYKNSILISNLEGINININLGLKLRPIASLFKLNPLRSKVKDEFTFFDGILRPVPFASKESVTTYLQTDINGIEKQKIYFKDTYLNQIYYHNLIIRQWRGFKHTITNSTVNTRNPGRDDLSVDNCYDCTREIDVHQRYLKLDGLEDTQEIRDQINNITEVLNTNSLYVPPHGVFPNMNMAKRRTKLANYIQAPRRERKVARRIIY